MKSLGFKQCKADTCVMRLVDGGEVTMVVVVHVDDIFSIGRKSRCVRFGEDLNRYVPISNLGGLKRYAGCRFSRDLILGTVTISQQAVAERIVTKFRVSETKDTPMVVGLKLDEFVESGPNVDEPFRSPVGSLMLLANQTRPDILNAVRAVSRYSDDPKLLHREAALHVVMYIKGTSSYGITFQRGTESVCLEVFVDSDFASRATGVCGVCLVCL